MKTKPSAFKQPVCSTLLAKLSLATGILLLPIASALADEHTAGTPQLSSLPGAAYTIYLNFAGFNYTGTWSGQTPGSSAAYADVPTNGTFNAQQTSDIRTVWAKVAQQYTAFNVNVTTVDPAVAAGQSGTDLARQNFYAATPDLMQTIITNQNHGGTDWLSPGFAGVSFTGTTNGSDNSSFGQGHTNWIFSAGTQYDEVGNTNFIAQGAVHENGHGLALGHQSDYVGNTIINGYSIGDNDTNGAKTGPGSYGAIMGDGNNAQRLAWRSGDVDNQTSTHLQNDVARMLSENTVAHALSAGRTAGGDLQLREDGIGHTNANATNLSLLGDGTVNFSLATGVIVPLSASNPDPTGEANYTKDWFTFTLTQSSSITLTAHDGSQFLVPGVADGFGSLRSTLSIFNSVGGAIGSAVEDTSTLFETYSGTLGAGTYYAQVASFGGHSQDNTGNPSFNPSNYFDTGSYFLTGSGFSAEPAPSSVPEPGSILFGAIGILGFLARRK